MKLENQTNNQESPLEKAKRLKTEKELRDKIKENKHELEEREKSLKLNNFNIQKQSLEDELSELDSKIEASQVEAHETRDVMKDAELNIDEDSKNEYNSVISEVASNLNELRNERNEILEKLEKINSNIENFEINEIIFEGNNELKNVAENINKENKETVYQVENSEGVEVSDIKSVEEVVTETENSIDITLEEYKDGTKEVLNQESSEKIIDVLTIGDLSKNIDNFFEKSKNLKEIEESQEDWETKYPKLKETRQSLSNISSILKDEVKKMRILLDQVREKSPEELKIEQDINNRDKDFKEKWESNDPDSGKGLDTPKEKYEKAEKRGIEIMPRIKKDNLEYQKDIHLHDKEYIKSVSDLMGITKKNNLETLKNLLENKNIDSKIVNKLANYINEDENISLSYPKRDYSLDYKMISQNSERLIENEEGAIDWIEEKLKEFE